MVGASEQGDEIQTLPATGLPTEAGLEIEAALQEAADSQLTDVRKAADSWRTGLGALIALVATIFFIKGRESVFDISSGWRQVLALVLIVAFAAAVYGAWEAMRAAFGEYATVDWDDVLAEGGWTGYQGSLAERAATQLKRAQTATLAALTCLVVAVLVTWFAPEPASATIVSVTTKTNEIVCGKLSGGIADGAPIQMEDKAPIALTDVYSFVVVHDCGTG